MKNLIISQNDNVAVDLSTGHKIALTDINKGNDIIKYGYPIGHAVNDIKKGEAVHTSNLKTNLSGIVDYNYAPKLKQAEKLSSKTFMGYKRESGKVGIRNDIWIINTVGCVNKTAEILAKKTGAFSFAHPFGCSQLGGDHSTTQKVLKGLVNHPNAGGVLILGLGCENNNINELKKILGDINPNRVKFLETQKVNDEITEGIRLIEELKTYANTFKREEISIDQLVVGLKCGGSDAFSGITANPLVGRFCDTLTSYGGSAILSEVPEMFGAEQILMNRCENEEVFNKTVELINNFKQYFIRYNQVVYENPSPGNKEGGITTLEEKSLGCVQKCGSSNVVDVLDYGDSISKTGLNLLNGPGNDIVACTNLTAAGANLILFTTGRGTPLGAPVPTIKISSNSRLFNQKNNWIDFNAGSILDGEDLAKDFFDFVMDIVNGRETKNEINEYREISIFKDGVTL
ncbi:altronate dehydratase family protein [Clostridium sp.]|uniref:UxaA family hydrolase n=1 Tax=Clostridium sp. TaxID=1506 RepID=UPI00283BE79C|nr:altronate dehydratase family protein [Clostridium sp.]MDR3593723.1 altronate dehydratase family protein [Clostridium sp.]